MSDEMEVETIERIEARVKAASVGPWIRNGKAAVGWRIYNFDPQKTGLAFLSAPVAMVPAEGDVEFIAHAREDVPALIEEILRLRREIGGLEGAVTRANGLVENAREVAEKDGLERRELQRVVNAAINFVENRPDDEDGQDVDDLFGTLIDSVRALTPTSAKARARVIEVVKDWADTYDGDTVRTQALMNALEDLKALEAAARG